MLIHSTSLRLAGVSLALLLLVASHAAADTVRILVDRALIVSKPGGVGVVITQASRNTELTVLRQVDDWYEVVLPGARSGAGAPTGYIRVSQAVVWILTPNGPMTAHLATSHSASPRPAAAIFVHVDAGYRVGGSDLVRTTSAFSDVYAEEGSITTDYGNGSGPQIDLMGGVFFTRKLAIAGGFSYYQRTQDGHVDAEIPHPFYLNQPRSASFDSSDLTGTEFAFHVSLLVSAWDTPKQRLSIFGGPSFFDVSQKTPTGLSIAESYPYDEATIDGVTTESTSASAIGFHVGGDYTRFLGRNFGVGVAVRYSHATVDNADSSTSASGAHTTGTAGSAVISGGIRFRF